ncbi:MAG: CpaE family protein, partial [Candidatus Sericytochromatia bacterium]
DVLVAASAVSECAARALARQAALPAVRGPRGRVVVVFSLKGGIGKSTVSANLALAIHRASGLPTTAVDLSLPCGNLEMYLDVQPTRSIGELLAAGADIEPAMVRQALAEHPSGLRVLAGPRAASAEALTRHSCQPVLSALGEGGGLVVVDLGAFLEYAHASVLEAADLVVVPIMPIISSLGTLNQAREVLAGFGVSEDRILPILNHAGPETTSLTPDVVARLMGGPPVHALPWGGADVIASLNEGLPVVLHRPQSPLALAIDGLARDCLARLGVAAAEARPAPKPTLFDWLRGLFMPRGVAHVHP